MSLCDFCQEPAQVECSYLPTNAKQLEVWEACISCMHHLWNHGLSGFPFKQNPVFSGTVTFRPIPVDISLNT